MNPRSGVRVLSALSGLRISRRLTRSKFVREPARKWLRRSVLANESDVEDVTVLIGVRNRSDHRLVNSLRTIRRQTHPAHLVQPMVVDYGSDDGHARRTAEICGTLGAEYVWVDERGPWSRARCLNVGIRRCLTKYLMTSDVDMVFSPSYVSDAIAALARAPLAIVCAPMRDLPESSLRAFQEGAVSTDDLDLDAWKQQSLERFDGEPHPSLGITRTIFYQLIHGYDEYFEVWGGEDRDLMRRLIALGLDLQPMPTDSFYLHQWHPKFEGVAAGEESDVVRRNRTYVRHNYTILRNGPNWGLGADADAPSEA